MKFYSFEEQSREAADEFFMKEAYKEALLAFDKDEVPIGAIIVANGKVVGRGHNLTERLNDVTAHAEMQAFTSASNTIGAKYLHNCTLYVTVEPCVMCAGASYWTQISRIVFGALDEKRGYSRLNPQIIHPKTEIVGGVMSEECAALMRNFFLKKRLK
ncbi:CMP/dCMP deaminase zinc-binding protein [Pseudopedobacter saltans DSM 12145]|uniref:tRNA-specific adenosine deaminase n=1 Tax=Pseudopedobacter saltans (strain ATCC 51119 / DSM 12145 / JCM 21818 / CCUG 39354 / LMG 10337 / NBRC 100064 / NCIMB 13643) TaxID=762903 RepID=F0SEZ8_PSESL|nr:nucleoside deaminase [Pseudopedobacter saltans]ADY54066.1 CMP/dCMP deaminase zinc-binding protein [Pseudopedobacter saltans DSM 12145]